MIAAPTGMRAISASIMLTGQMYHLGEHFPNGLLLWALGLVPLTLLSGGRLLALQERVVRSEPEHGGGARSHAQWHILSRP